MKTHEEYPPEMPKLPEAEMLRLALSFLARKGLKRAFEHYVVRAEMERRKAEEER